MSSIFIVIDRLNKAKLPNYHLELLELQNVDFNLSYLYAT